jgi:hypothetical protein
VSYIPNLLSADTLLTSRSVYYAYGNIELSQKRLEQAWRAFDSCLKIALAETPISPITAAAYYSLACVEFEMDHPEPAK